MNRRKIVDVIQSLILIAIQPIGFGPLISEIYFEDVVP